MNIKIKSITLRNFKGLRDVSFDFDGRNATIIGDNGTGQPTNFDAHIARYGANRADRPTCDSSDTKVRLPSMAWRSEPRRHTTKSFRNG